MDPASLPDSFVWDVEEDASGNLWVATAGRARQWDRSTDRFVRLEATGRERTSGSCASRSSENALWIGTRDAGLLRLDLAAGSLTAFSHDAADPDSLADDRIYALHVDGKGRLWVGTDGGLDRLDAGTATVFTPFRERPLRSVEPRREQGARAARGRHGQRSGSAPPAAA